ncbi:MAG: hypothetical protein JW963_17965 [Anaerolineales bacterium]|nr:hypothetical protein [Anaerolineales bacterium]
MKHKPENQNLNEKQHTRKIPEEEFMFSIDLLFNHKYPHLAAYISLVLLGFGGIGQLLLGQENKAMLLLGIEWLIVFPIGIITGLLPYLLPAFHLFTALDAWVIAGRWQQEKEIGKWEWFWNKR